MEYYSATKQNEMIPLTASWIQLEITILSEVNQRERQILCDIVYTWNIKKKIQMDLFTKQKQTHRLRE